MWSKCLVVARLGLRQQWWWGNVYTAGIVFLQCENLHLPFPHSRHIVLADLGFTSIIGLFLIETSGEMVSTRQEVRVVLCRLCFGGKCPLPLSYHDPSLLLLYSHMEETAGESLAFLISFSLHFLIYWEPNGINRVIPQFLFYFPAFITVSFYFNY